MSVNNDVLSLPDTSSSSQSLENIYAALARTATRSLALYFSRPVRLFRPTKVSGWHSLRGLAMHQGASLTPQYLSSLVKTNGFMVIPKHFIPPMLVNAALGTVLWSTYAEMSTVLEPYLGDHPTILSASAGAMAGGMQALAAAPAENVRIIIEGGSGGHGWSHAWKEVFRGTSACSPSASQSREDVRQVRGWMKEVGEMAGRGWDGVWWGCAKDICGFAAFFAIFDVTRRLSVKAKTAAQDLVDSDFPLFRRERDSFRRHIPGTVHGITLVTGGVCAGLAYEIVSRPFDVARKIVQVDKLTHVPRGTADTVISPTVAIMRTLRDDGVLSFFRNPSVAHVHEQPGPRARFHSVARTLARVGPWGVGFLVWEFYGSS